MTKGVKGDVLADIWKYSLQHFLNSIFFNGIQIAIKYHKSIK